VVGLQGGSGRGSDLEELRLADKAYRSNATAFLYEFNLGQSATDAWDEAARRIGVKNAGDARRLAKRRVVGDSMPWSIGDVIDRIVRLPGMKRIPVMVRDAKLVRNDTSGTKKLS